MGQDTGRDGEGVKVGEGAHHDIYETCNCGIVTNLWNELSFTQFEVLSRKLAQYLQQKRERAHVLFRRRIREDEQFSSEEIFCVFAVGKNG